MAKRRILAAVVAVVLGALASTGAASAGAADRERPERVGRDHRALCERLESRIQHLRAAIGQLEALADRIEEKIASGELTPAQVERARHLLAKIEATIERLQEKLEKLLEVYEERCD